MTSFNYDPEAAIALRNWARMYADIQQARIALANRAAGRCAQCDKRAQNCKCGSKKRDIHYPVDPLVFQAAAKGLEETEKAFATQMKRAFCKAFPLLSAWQKATTGIGDHTLARLLGEIGHPRVAVPHHWEGSGEDRILIADEPYLRSVSQLWAYCGHGDPARKAVKGMGAEDVFALGRPSAKMIVHLMALGAIKEPHRSVDDLLGRTKSATEPNGPASDPTISDDSPDTETRSATQPTNLTSGIRDLSTAGDQSRNEAHEPDARQPWPYREVYEKWRWTYRDKTDADGKPWSDGHQNNAAIHNTAKAILKDIWIAAGEPT